MLRLPSRAQQETHPAHPLQSPASVKGTVGGEAHDSYIVQARKGQALAARISWQRTAGNHAEFSVSESPDVYSSTPIAFGHSSSAGTR